MPCTKKPAFTLIELLIACNPKHLRRKAIHGFTLIELLIVITIIGILATFVIASFTSAQQKARDSKRKSDLDAVKKALELARTDCSYGGYYPQLPNTPGGTPADRYVNLKTYLNTLKYINNPPSQDSLFTTVTGTYAYEYNYISGTNANVCPDTTGGTTQSGRTDFWLRATLENANDTSAVDSQARCFPGGAPGGGPTTKSYYTCSQ